MKVVCNGQTLADAVLKVSKALPQKTTNPILEGIKLTAKEDKLILFVSDSSLTIEKTIVAEVLTEGEVIVPGKLFTEYVRKLTNETAIEISLRNDNTLVIKYTDSEGSLQCLNLLEYPAFEETDRSSFFTIGQEEFKDIISKTIFSVAVDDARPILKGVLFEIADYTLTAVALDGYRMALCKKPLATQAQSEMSAVIPSRSLSEISKLFDDADKTVNVYLDGRTVMVDLGHTKICSGLVSGDFINYNQIIQKDFTTTINVSRAQLNSALDRASILSRGEKQNLVILDIKENKMLLSSTSEQGNIKETLAISTWGKDITIAFNAKFISDCLIASGDDFVKMNFKTAGSPCVITPCQSDEYLFLILPIRVV